MEENESIAEVYANGDGDMEDVVIDVDRRFEELEEKVLKLEKALQKLLQAPLN